MDYNGTRMKLSDAQRKVARALKYGPDMRSSQLILARELAEDLRVAIRNVDAGLYH